MTTQVNEQIAAKIVSHQKRPPVNITALAQECGLNVWEADLGIRVSGKLLKDPKHGGESGYSILVNSREPFVRRRFTVAHELAHYILHREMVRRLGSLTEDVFYRAHGLNSWQEMEANKLAAEILMPQALVNQLKRIKTPQELATLFQVSEPAMRIRLSLQTAPIKLS
jgi:Zn-dependent peptidase ImmA (M78 family)